MTYEVIKTFCDSCPGVKMSVKLGHGTLYHDDYDGRSV